MMLSATMRPLSSITASSACLPEPITRFVERLWRSVKYEDVYLRGYATLPELRAGLMEYFVFYNTERLRQSLDYVTPDEVYRSASGGGARIVDQFGETASTPPETQQEREHRGSAVPLHVTGYPLKLDA